MSVGTETDLKPLRSRPEAFLLFQSVALRVGLYRVPEFFVGALNWGEACSVGGTACANESLLDETTGEREFEKCGGRFIGSLTGLVREHLGDTASEIHESIAAATGQASSHRPLLISDLGWTQSQALEARVRLTAFEEDWDAPGMELYDQL